MLRILCFLKENNAKTNKNIINDSDSKEKNHHEWGKDPLKIKIKNIFAFVWSLYKENSAIPKEKRLFLSIDFLIFLHHFLT